jgi:hypothetical protein
MDIKLKFLKPLWSVIFLTLLGNCFFTTVLFAEDTSSSRKYHSLRYLEDYSFLSDSNQQQDFFDPIKFISLSSSGDIHLSIGGETRQHFEYIEDENWGATTRDDDGWYLQRYLLHADLKIGKRVRFFSQLMSTIEDGRAGGPRGVDQDILDLHQAFADVAFPGVGDSFLIRIGRQEMVYGSRRFVNYRERPNTRLSFDGIRMIIDYGPWNVSGFATRPVEVDQGIFDDGGIDGQAFWGLYGVRKMSVRFPETVDLYYLGIYREQAQFDQGVGNETRHAFGTRLSGKGKGFDYNFEGMFQVGTFGSKDIFAYAFASDTGYTFSWLGRKWRVGLRADIYSGDNDPGDSELNSFNPFFPKGKHISQLAASGLINQRDLQPRINVNLLDNVLMTVSSAFIWRDSLYDGIYSIGNALLRSGTTSRARYVGHQPEVEIKWQVDRHLALKGTFNYFFAGPFIKETGSGDDIKYLGAMATYVF